MLNLTCSIAIITCDEKVRELFLVAVSPRLHDASAVCCRDQAQEPSALGWLERQFLQQALMCRSVEVLGAFHLSQAHDFVTNGVLDP